MIMKLQQQVGVVWYAVRYAFGCSRGVIATLLLLLSEERRGIGGMLVKRYGDWNISLLKDRFETFAWSYV